MPHEPQFQGHSASTPATLEAPRYLLGAARPSGYARRGGRSSSSPAPETRRLLARAVNAGGVPDFHKKKACRTRPRLKPQPLQPRFERFGAARAAPAPFFLQTPALPNGTKETVSGGRRVLTGHGGAARRSVSATSGGATAYPARSPAMPNVFVSGEEYQRQRSGSFSRRCACSARDTPRRSQGARRALWQASATSFECCLHSRRALSGCSVDRAKRASGAFLR